MVTIKRYLSGLYLLGALLFILSFILVRKNYGKIPFLLMYGLKYDEIHFYLFYFIFILPAAFFLSLFLWRLYSRSIRNKIFELIFHKRFILFILLCSFSIILFVRFIVLNNSVVTDDEYCYYFIAQTLLKGRLYNISHPLAEFFNNNDIINNGKWYGFPTIGYPLILSLGVALKLPWLINPLISILILYMIFLIAKGVYDKKVAALSVVLLMFSPMFIFLGSTNLIYPATALIISIMIYSILKFLHSNKTIWSISIGILLAALLFVRPIDTLIITIVMSAIFFKEIFIPFRKERLRKIFIAVLIAIVGLMLFLLVNYFQTGNPFKLGIDVYCKGRIGFGIGSQAPTNPPYVHTVTHAIKNTIKNLIRENFWLFGWPISLLFFIFCRKNKWSIFLFSYFALHIFMYSMFWNSGLGFMGPFYYYTISPFTILLSASGIIVITQYSKDSKYYLKLKRFLPAFIVSLVLLNITIFLPIQSISLHNMVDGIQLMYRTVEKAGVHSNAIIFVENIKPARAECTSQDFSNVVHGLRNNSPDLVDDVLFVNDLGVEKNAELLRYFTRRKGYLYRVENKQPILKEMVFK